MNMHLSRGRLPEFRQAEAAECGLACLAMIASYHGDHTGLNALRRQHPVSLNGVTMRSLMQTAGKLGLAGRPLRLEPQHMSELRTPAILHWDMNHFVVLQRAGRNKITIHDPALGVRGYTLAEFSKHFTGIALELHPVESFAPTPKPKSPPFWALLGRIDGLAPALLQMLALSAILQLYVLASPFLLQLVVDEAVAKVDVDLILVLSVGFGLFLLINTGAAVLRTRILQLIQSALAFQMGAGIFNHLLRLPLVYFEKRHIGDLVSRFASNEAIRHLITEGLISGIVDGAMAVLTMAMMFVYSIKFGLIVVAALLLYLGLRVAFYRMMRTTMLTFISSKAREDTAFIETVRAIQAIKLFSRETERSAAWSNIYAEVVNSDSSLAALRKNFGTINAFIFGVENIVIVALGAHAALHGHMTIGMLLAFLAYKQQFVDKATRLVETAIEFRMLDLHFERLGDIAGTEPEPRPNRPPAYQPQIEGRVEARNLSFRYSDTDRFIFENVSFAIEPGEHVAITGPSGAGKTTLMKVLLGILQPTSGEVLIDGIPLGTLGYEAYRRAIGVVMQDDSLLSGSIADNICFFDESFDLEHMMRCAELAGIHDDIVRMPMGYNSLIGDMGSTLSGGQKQRVLLARALYRAPCILFIDEGTSHLDVTLERQVTASVKSLGLTRIVIAHRPETVAAASRALALDMTGLAEANAQADVACAH
ncbi:MAG: peptidase domain-containing ABC transporter [Acetobacteraceae bacterium]